MFPLKTILMILALVAFFLAAAEVQAPRINLTATGLFLWALATMVG